MKYTLLLFFTLLFQGCMEKDNKLTTICGTAVNLNDEAILITKDGVYQIEGVADWNDFTGKRVEVKGVVDTITIDTSKAIELDRMRILTYYKDKEHRMKVMRNPKWELDSIQNNSKITVFGIAENMKYGRVVFGDKEMFYMEDGEWLNWNDSIIGKKITVTGYLNTTIINAYSESFIEQSIGTNEAIEIKILKDQ